jgi:Zn-dependent alcohol dehydrogenase
MKTRAIIDIEHGKPLIVDEINIPDPAPDQVLVKLFASGICHTQLAWVESPAMRRPTMLGHEATGVVVSKGSGVTHVEEGDHVIVTWVSRYSMVGPNVRREPSGITYKGEPVAEMGISTWTEHTLANERLVVPIPKEIPTDITSIIGCAVLTGAGAVLNTAKVRPGQSVAIFGIGGIGVSALQAAVAVRAFPVIAVDLIDQKLDYALRMGATHVVNASKEDAVAKIHELTGGGVDFAFDAIGAPITAQQIFSATRPGGIGADNHGGMSVLIGMVQGEVSLDMNQMMLSQRTYRGSFGATRPDQDFPMFVRWYQEGKMDLDHMVTDRFKMEQINEALDAMRQGKILGRAIIEF